MNVEALTTSILNQKPNDLQYILYDYLYAQVSESPQLSVYLQQRLFARQRWSTDLPDELWHMCWNWLTQNEYRCKAIHLNRQCQRIHTKLISVHKQNVILPVRFATVLLNPTMQCALIQELTLKAILQATTRDENQSTWCINVHLPKVKSLRLIDMHLKHDTDSVLTMLRDICTPQLLHLKIVWIGNLNTFHYNPPAGFQPDLSRLQSVELHYQKLMDSSWARLMLLNCVKFRLFHCQIIDTFFDQLNTLVEEVSIHSCTLIPLYARFNNALHWKKLSCINWMNTSIRYQTRSIFQALMETRSPLKHMGLSIYRKADLEFIGAMSWMSQIHSLKLEPLYYGSGGVEGCDLANLSRHCTQLTHLAITYMTTPQTSPWLFHGNCLQRVYLKFIQRAEDETSRICAAAFKNCTHLKELNISYCNELFSYDP